MEQVFARYRHRKNALGQDVPSPMSIVKQKAPI